MRLVTVQIYDKWRAKQHHVTTNGNPNNRIPVWEKMIGGPCRSRTYNLRIKSPLLCQLS